ncbi:MAG: thiolase family protein [bacterium]|nr:thiolase family protein [bacterium]
MRKSLFVAPLRTAFGRAFKGYLSEIRPDDLLVRLLENQKIKYRPLFDYKIDDHICGCAYPEGEQGYNIARMVALGSGLKLPGLTVNRLCASSMEAVAIASSRVSLSQADIVLVSGVESMSRIQRKGATYSESSLIRERSPKAYVNMGETAEEVATISSLSRLEQEDFAARSHELADVAYSRGYYSDYVLELDGVARDEGIRVPVNREKMASLKPAFREDGCVTAATSSPLSDGATSGFIVNETIAKDLRLDGLEILDCSWGQVAPELMGLGPVPAVEKILKRNKLKPQQIDAYEINEAFAVQVLACQQELNLPLDRINNWGGAISIGHPLGASGLRLMMTLLGRLKKLSKPRALGLSTLCVGGGQGLAILCQYASYTK